MSAQLTPEEFMRDQAARHYQADCDFRARRSNFIICAALMFNVKCEEVTQQQYNAAVRFTEDCTMPKDVK